MKTIGIIASLLFLVSSAAMAQQAPAQRDGRFVIMFSPLVRADTFLLDTATGKIWQMVQMSDVKGEPKAWEFMDRVDDFKAESAFIAAHGGFKPEATPETAPAK